MKILFILNAVTHYYNLILNQINNQPGIEILYIYPKNKSNNIGEGVFQTTDRANFKLIDMEEQVDTIHNYSYYVGLNDFIKINKPSIIVLSEYHIQSFLFDENLLKTIKAFNIKIILKSIPFQKKTYADAILDFKKKLEIPPELKSLPPFIRTLVRFFRINYLYKYAFRDIKARCNFMKNLDAEKKTYNFPDAHVNYIEEAYEVFGSYGVPKEKIFLTYNSPDTDFYFSVKYKIEKEPRILPENKYRIVHLSRLVEWKRVDMLITAVANLKDEYPEIELLVIGEGPEKEKLKKQALALAVDCKIIFLGGIYNPELLGKYLLSSSIYILAGMGGLSINDAMIFGLPVICSVCDGTEKFLVKEGYNGLYFEKENQKSLESKIKLLFSNHELRKKMGENSVQIIKDEINIHTVVDGYLKAFSYVMKHS